MGISATPVFSVAGGHFPSPLLLVNHVFLDGALEADALLALEHALGVDGFLDLLEPLQRIRAPRELLERRIAPRVPRG